ncbi:tryptophan--tRNA ligase [Longimicrobium sp.]|uniref:tryptophan--tRNA ligase n=1 Tax=Longimicrobium sp. TaxID=2029185 RepID=UPI002C1F8470|nr:tryptophan--tRNA ligase [Longimicrobium sp.]HSU12646.1 tryptophan--tRNA ligase [Longimicrobium sp.]
MKRILTGLQPSGTLHVGNYFGAIRPMVDLQGQGEVFLFLADLHALTSTRDAAELRQYTREAAIDLLACGLDPARTVFWRQSDVALHAELMWILSTVTPKALMERAVAYKDKVQKGLPADVGLFTYPILQAADILLYDADLVPVGKDQMQHLEMTRDIAIKINETYGEGTLKLPEAQVSEEVAVVPGLDGQKMSKSYGNTVVLFGDEKTTRKRVMSIVTDSTPLEAPKDPSGSTVVALYKLFASKEDVARMEDEHRAGGVGYGTFKQRLFEAMWEFFAPMRARREELLARPDYVNDVLRDGAARAREVGERTMARVRAAVGID